MEAGKGEKREERRAQRAQGEKKAAAATRATSSRAGITSDDPVDSALLLHILFHFNLNPAAERQACDRCHAQASATEGCDHQAQPESHTDRPPCWQHGDDIVGSN